MHSVLPTRMTCASLRLGELIKQIASSVHRTITLICSVRSQYPFGSSRGGGHSGQPRQRFAPDSGGFGADLRHPVGDHEAALQRPKKSSDLEYIYWPHCP